MREPDPIGAWLRTTRAQRRVGPDAVCASCGIERRPQALISGYAPPRCFRCDRLRHRRPPYELNHAFGKRNSDLTIRYPINEHRAVLSVKQLDWTPETLENPTGDVLLEGVARYHGLNDNTAKMLADCVAFAAKLIRVRNLLVSAFGENWLPGLEAAAARASHETAPKPGADDEK